MLKRSLYEDTFPMQEETVEIKRIERRKEDVRKTEKGIDFIGAALKFQRNFRAGGFVILKIQPVQRLRGRRVL